MVARLPIYSYSNYIAVVHLLPAIVNLLLFAIFNLLVFVHNVLCYISVSELLSG